MSQVITIARQLGAGGRDVASRLAEALGWRLLERALVERIALELSVDPEQVEACDERVESFVERLGIYLAEGYPEFSVTPNLPPVSPEVIARTARHIVGVVVDEGPAVIVGHGAQCVLQDDTRAFHVLLHAPLALRVERVRERYGVAREAAEQRVRRSDADRRGYLRENFGREWLDPTLYHLCVDTGRLGITAAVELIRAAAGGNPALSGAPPSGDPGAGPP